VLLGLAVPVLVYLYRAAYYFDIPRSAVALQILDISLGILGTLDDFGIQVCAKTHADDSLYSTSASRTSADTNVWIAKTLEPDPNDSLDPSNQEPCIENR
jgi:hypothetical protein